MEVVYWNKNNRKYYFSYLNLLFVILVLNIYMCVCFDISNATNGRWRIYRALTLRKAQEERTYEN